MMQLTKSRESKGLSRTKLGSRAEVHPARVGQIENGRVIPYPGELARIAAALEWQGDPAGLLAEVE